MKTTHIVSIAALTITSVACSAEENGDFAEETEAALTVPGEEAPSLAAYVFDHASRTDAQPAFRGGIDPVARATFPALDEESAFDEDPTPEEEQEQEEGWAEGDPEQECDGLTGCGEVPESPFGEACRTELATRVKTIHEEGRFTMKLSYEDSCFESRLDAELEIRNPTVNHTSAWGEIDGTMHIQRLDSPVRAFGRYLFDLDDTSVARVELIIADPAGYEFGYAHGIAHFDGLAFSHFDMLIDY